jgi:hypothetical protein
MQPAQEDESRRVEGIHEPPDPHRRPCRGPAPPVSLRGGCSAALRPVPRVPGNRGLATRDLTVEPSRHSPLDTCQDRGSPALRASDVAASDHQQGSAELMLTVLILVVFAAVALVLIMLAVVVFAIRQEPRDTEMSNVAPSLIAVIVRRLLGVYVRRPTPPTDSTDWREEWSPDTRPATSRSRPPGGRR